MTAENKPSHGVSGPAPFDFGQLAIHLRKIADAMPNMADCDGLQGELRTIAAAFAEHAGLKWDGWKYVPALGVTVDRHQTFRTKDADALPHGLRE